MKYKITGYGRYRFGYYCIELNKVFPLIIPTYVLWQTFRVDEPRKLIGKVLDIGVFR